MVEDAGLVGFPVTSLVSRAGVDPERARGLVGAMKVRGAAIEIDGRFQDRDCTVRYAAGGRVAAVATVFRNRASLEAEHRMQQELDRSDDLKVVVDVEGSD